MSKRKINPYALLSLGFLLVILVIAGLWYQHANGGFPFGGISGSGPSSKYTCPMHPTYISDKDGECPICGMDLVPVEDVSAEGDNIGGYTTINISPQKQQLIGLKTVQVLEKEIVKTINVVGMVEVDENRIYHVHTKYKGWIERVFVAGEGDPVYYDQPLLSIYSPELYASQKEYLLALEGAKRMEGSSVVGLEEGSLSLLEAARQRLKLWDFTDGQISLLEETGIPLETVILYSPYYGYVTSTKAEPGMYVQPGTELFSIVDTSQVWILADIYESDLPFIKKGQTATLKMPFGDSELLEGKIEYIYPYVEGSSRTVKARFKFPNPGRELLPMMYVSVILEVDLGKNLVIPTSAILTSGSREIVFVAGEDGHFEPREVQVLTKAGDEALILTGLLPGEEVVSSGNFLIDSESQLKAALSDMGSDIENPTTSEEESQDDHI